MSSEELLKIKTIVLKVSIHCEGCKRSVKRILRNIEGVYTVKVDSDMDKVTVVGNYNLDPEILVHKLQRKGKHADLWDAPKINNNTNNLDIPLKNLSTENGGGDIICNNRGKNQPLVGGSHGQSSQTTQPQQLKAIQEQKLPVNKEQAKKKSVTFSVPSDDLIDENELDDDHGNFDEDETDIAPQNKTKSTKVTRHANGTGPKIPNGKDHQFMRKRGNSNGSANVDAGNAKNATHINIKGGCASQDSAKDKKSNGENTQDGSSKSGGITNAINKKKKNMANVPKKGHGLTNTPQENHNMVDMNGASVGQTNNISSLHGLQASGMDGGGSGGGENSKQQDLEQMHGNEQQYSNWNEISQPILNVPCYGHNIMYMPYSIQDTVAPPPIRRDEDYTFFSDEDTKSCIVM